MDSAKPIDSPISPSTRLVMDDGSPSVEEKSYRGMMLTLEYKTQEGGVNCVLAKFSQIKLPG